MSFQTPITIYDAIKNISSRKYLLPAIQREFVWSEEQIERLFDSIMRGYPIGSFLFWKVSKESVKKYQFYEFIVHYYQGKSHNQKAVLMEDEEIISILDGQQRLTSLYIALKGNYASKVPYMRWNNPAAFPKKYLYLNLLKEADDEALKYNFRFLTEEDAKKRDENTFWFKVGDILNFDPKKSFELHKFLINNNLNSDFAGECLFRLSQVIHEERLINYFLEEDQELDKVLNIFIRVNSGGTQLSYSDLLLSIATSQWDKRDAREEIIKFVDEINSIGRGFAFNKDFVLKTCLVLCDFNDIRFKVDNFNTQNMAIIQDNWDKIKESIRTSVELINTFGFDYQTLTSNNAIIPIAYYLYKKGLNCSFVTSSNFRSEREKIKKWLHIVLLKQIFGGQSDNILRIIRDVIRDNLNGFPVDIMKQRLKGTPKSLDFGEDEIENLLEYEYGKRYTFSVLALLYPTLDYSNLFHQDHIHPRSVFTSREKLLKLGVKPEDIDFCLENYNKIPNLQLLQGNINMSKGAKPFVDWLDENYKDDIAKNQYKELHYLSELDLFIANFRDFFNKRKEMMKDSLMQILMF
ncbi:DUF262 domain-containing protein [Thermoanaerobacterium thermosaccharolyticum]|uniref:DUF262 domain-containing protein n=1 Tax=Thermoanaerobacterium thermosaccharolyticum TaxID=1517 RepID=UPI001785D60A|nr:DUF262 domain-containing protein [Thermoanaerobacterium thermosaccharolyticum]MBE0069319.1 DUF262 domain-containing protein [Thermoanaerobacterium thermosaccharolyticum]MBE0229100.1 DUF262 domain-containing protein [Thermoanaerobacterium thermosaccharolyticum]